MKSVVTALPNHVMSCYRIPKTVITKVTSAKFLVDFRRKHKREACIKNPGINFALRKRKEVWVLRIFRILIWLC